MCLRALASLLLLPTDEPDVATPAEGAPPLMLAISSSDSCFFFFFFFFFFVPDVTPLMREKSSVMADMPSESIGGSLCFFFFFFLVDVDATDAPDATLCIILRPMLSFECVVVGTVGAVGVGNKVVVRLGMETNNWSSKVQCGAQRRGEPTQRERAKTCSGSAPQPPI